MMRRSFLLDQLVLISLSRRRRARKEREEEARRQQAIREATAERIAMQDNPVHASRADTTRQTLYLNDACVPTPHRLTSLLALICWIFNLASRQQRPMAWSTSDDDEGEATYEDPDRERPEYVDPDAQRRQLTHAVTSTTECLSGTEHLPNQCGPSTCTTTRTSRPRQTRTRSRQG